MKILILLLASSFLGPVVFAQAYEGTVQYDKKKQDAIVIEYDYPAQAVENAFVLRMERLGFRPKEEKGILNRDKGFLVFRNAYIPEISEKRMDYIISVERKSRKEEDESVLYVIVQNDGVNTLRKMESRQVENAKRYVNDMVPDIEAAHLELQISEQQDAVAKAEKKLRDLEDENNSLKRKLSDNEKSQKDTKADIEAQKKALELLEEKRKKDN